MSGNLRTLSEAQKSTPSAGYLWFDNPSDFSGMGLAGCIACFDPPLVLPATLFQRAWSAFEDSLLDAKDESLPIPTTNAVELARGELSNVICLLLRDLQPSHIPIASAVVTASGAIEIVGYYHKQLGRYVVTIDQNGGCTIWDHTSWKRKR